MMKGHTAAFGGVGGDFLVKVPPDSLSAESETLLKGDEKTDTPDRECP